MRFLAVLLCVCMLFGLCACGESKTETSSFGSSLIENTGSQAVGDKNSSVNNIEQGSAVTPSNGDASSENSSTDNAASNVTTSSDTVSSSTASNNSTTSSNPSTGTTSSVTSSSVSSETVSSNSNTSSSQTSSTQTPSTTPEVTVVNTQGNSTLNIYNGAQVAGQGDWVYFRNYRDNNYLYKMRTNGTEKKKLINAGVTSGINVIGDWIYFYSFHDNTPFMYRVKNDGSEYHRLLLPTGKSYKYVYVKDNFVNIAPYRFDTDFTESTKVIKVVDAFWVTYSDNQIYYCDTDHRLWRANIDGTEPQRMDNYISYNAKYPNYFIDGYQFSFVSVDKSIHVDIRDPNDYNRSRDKVIYLGGVSGFAYQDGWLYYSVEDDGMRKLSLEDTNERIILSETGGSSMCIVGDYIYYYRSTCLRRVKIDGTGSEEAVR